MGPDAEQAIFVPDNKLVLYETIGTNLFIKSRLILFRWDIVKFPHSRWSVEHVLRRVIYLLLLVVFVLEKNVILWPFSIDLGNPFRFGSFNIPDYKRYN